MSKKNRVTVEKRTGFKDNIIRLKFLTGSGAPGEYVEIDSRANPGWDPAEVYKFRLEWGGGVVRLRVTKADGSEFLAMQSAYQRTYAPPKLWAEVGIDGGGEHITLPGMKVRRVRIGRK